MAIRFSLFGRRTSAPNSRQARTYASLKDAAAEAGLLPPTEAVRHIRDRARERLARADQAFDQLEGSENVG
ncbi:MAG: hypothetical protein IE925_07825 [Rhodobacterales bacterium]|jgi:hypothetical protein|nr:hypothetical protein [Rhodobacterales bacterium]